MRGSYSGRVPRSSLEKVHREFVHRILDDEVDGQKEGQGEKREDGEEGEERGWNECGPKLEPCLCM